MYFEQACVWLKPALHRMGGVMCLRPYKVKSPVIIRAQAKNGLEWNLLPLTPESTDAKGLLLFGNNIFVLHLDHNGSNQ